MFRQLFSYMNNSRYLSRNTKKIPLFQLLRLRICCLLNDNENIMFLKASILQLSATGHCTAFVECTCSFCGVSNWLFILDFTHSVQFLTPQTDWQLRGNSFCLVFASYLCACPWSPVSPLWLLFFVAVSVSRPRRCLHTASWPMVGGGHFLHPLWLAALFRRVDMSLDGVCLKSFCPLCTDLFIKRNKSGEVQKSHWLLMSHFLSQQCWNRLNCWWNVSVWTQQVSGYWSWSCFIQCFVLLI